MWLGDYGVSRPKLNLSRWDRTALHPVKSPTHRNSPNFPKRLQTSLITTANNRIGLLTKLVEVRLHLIRRGFLTDSANKNLLRLVGLRFWLWSRVLWVDLLSIEGVRRNWKNSIHGFWGRKRDETEASAPLKEKNLLRMGNMLQGGECAPMVNYFLALDKNTGFKTELHDS